MDWFRVFGQWGRRLALGAAGLGAWLALWQLATMMGPLADQTGLPDAAETLKSMLLLSQSGDFWGAVATSLIQVAVAMAAVTILGLLVGVSSGRSVILRSLIEPTSQFLRPIPAVVVLPLLLLMFGPTNELAIALAVVGGIWPVVVQAEVGVRSVDPVALDTGRALGLSRRMTYTAIVLPSALPFLATGVRIAGGLTLMLTIGAGILGGSPGLGRSIVLAQQTGQTALVFAIMLWAGVLGLLVNGVLSAAESRLSRGRSRKDRK